MKVNEEEKPNFLYKNNQIPTNDDQKLVIKAETERSLNVIYILKLEIHSFKEVFLY